MARNFSTCNSRECHITGYGVVVEEGQDSGTVQLSLVDPCNTLSRPCDAKALLIKVYRDWVTMSGGDASVDCCQCLNTNQRCPNGGPGMAFYYGTKTLVITTDLTPPAAPLETFVALPMEGCDVSVFV